MNSKIMSCKCIVIGVSAGGMEALLKVLPAFPQDFPLPIVIVQHIHKTQSGIYVEFYNERCALIAEEAKDKQSLESGKIYFAPPNYHLLIEDDETLSLCTSERVNYARPSIDVLFESAADVFGEELIGVILTGANDDGSEGMKQIKQNGGFTIVQNPKDAEFPAMPQFAIDAAEPNLILTLDEMVTEFSGWSKDNKFPKRSFDEEL